MPIVTMNHGDEKIRKPLRKPLRYPFSLILLPQIHCDIGSLVLYGSLVLIVDV